MHAHPIAIELYALEDVLLGLVPRPIAPLFRQFPFQRLGERPATALSGGVPGLDADRTMPCESGHLWKEREACCAP